MIRGLPVAHPRRFVGALALLVLAADVFACLTGAPRWMGWAPATLNAFQGLSRFADPIVGAAAALAAGNARRLGLGAWGAAASRSRLAQVLAILAPLTTCAFLVHLACLGVMSVITANRGPVMGLGLWAAFSVLTSLPVTAFWCMTGLGVGLRLPRSIAVAFSAMAPYVAVALVDAHAYGTPAAILTFANSGGFSMVRLTDSTTVIRFFVWTMLAAVALCTVARVRGRASTTAMVLLSLALTVGFANGYAMQDIPGAAARTCIGGTPAVCTSASYSAALPDYRRLVDEVWAHVPTTMRRDVVDSSADGAGTAIAAGPTDGRDDPSLVVNRQASIAALGEALWPRPATCSAMSMTNRSAFQVYWLQRFGIAIDGSASPSSPDYASVEDALEISRIADRLAGMTPAAREAWVTDAFADPSCSTGRSS